MNQVHKDMLFQDDLSSNLSVVKVEVNDVKELLSTMQADVRTNAEAISTLNDKADKAQTQLTRHDQVLELDLLQTQSLAELEQRLDIIVKSLDDLISRYVDDKEGEKDLAADVAITPADDDAQDVRAEANEAASKVVDVVTSREAEAAAEAEENDDVVRADAQDEDHPVTSTTNAGDKDEENDDDDDEDDDDSPSFPDAEKDLDVDDDDETTMTTNSLFNTTPNQLPL
ncbi:ribosomal L1 domain-containing protein CG13096-like [Cynara cardunculus var. scolymus]|uniref:ribosomal L1 domain-containing protein CG13096-like n=1 Tax=Cynara cardunculus var. scolymus TaxID=59895 RepID=UPI000D623BED|nr:ribosomal L1 domain-containing protein CG13096-like [Cynara cardunculus var. scolymus]